MFDKLKTGKFEGMSTRKLLEYVWDYYKFHILAVIFGLFILGSFINSIFINPSAKQYVNVVVYGKPVALAGIEELKTLLTHELVPEELKGRYEALTDNLYADNNQQVSMAMQQKFAALLTLGEIDVIIAERDDFEELAKNGAFAEIEDVLGENLSAVAFVSYEGRNYGIDVSLSAALKKCGIILENPAAGIPAAVRRPEAAMEAFKLLLTGD